jgi:hypothetical protein
MFTNSGTVTGGAPSLQKRKTKNLKHIFPEKELRGHSPSFHIHVSVSDLYIPTIGLPILMQEYMYVDRSREYRSQTQASQFPEKKYINEIFVAV